MSSPISVFTATADPSQRRRSRLTTVQEEEEEAKIRRRSRRSTAESLEQDTENEEEDMLSALRLQRRLFLGHNRRCSPFQILLAILLSITVCFICYSSFSLSPLLRLYDPYSYVLVLDAGSTGTRLHVYKFKEQRDAAVTYVLKDELFVERKPGLSSFSDDVSKAESQIDDLLKIADRQVTRFKHRATPLVLRATAGLRLIKESKQKALLNRVDTTFSKYGFYRPKMDIGIMNETEEGIDAWLTLVYLKGEQFYASRIAALDLGGGSTQITYNPSLANTSLANKLNLLMSAQQPAQPSHLHAFRDPANKDGKMPKIDVANAGLEEIKPAKHVPKQDPLEKKGEETAEERALMAHMHQFAMFSRDIRLYSRSYLGYGLMIARQLIFLNDTTDENRRRKQQLNSRCMPRGLKGTFKFQDISWTVEPVDVAGESERGMDDRFYECMSSIDTHIGSSVQPAVGLDQMTVYVFSYFYDIVLDAGLLPTTNGEKEAPSPSEIVPIQIRTLKKTAQQMCRSTSSAHPFLCFDLTYIYALLTKGYGLEEDAYVHVCKKIQQFEVAWSLGLALKLL